MRFYAKLAVNNLWQQRKLYAPFAAILSLMMMITILMFNVVLLGHKIFKGIGNTGQIVFLLGGVVVVIMSIILANYGNQFIMRHRIAQFGLYSEIGFSKRELVKMLFFENVFFIFFTLICACVFGAIFSRLGYLIIARFFGISPNQVFGIKSWSFVAAFFVMLIIFFFLMGRDLFWVKGHNPIQMIRRGKEGEKEPKTRWFILVFGVVCLGIGYYLALKLHDPLAAMTYFFLAVILVILGTYFLFIAGSIFILKLLRRNKNYYYQPNHFIGLSNLLIRMKQNGAGLASITILNTMTILTMASSVVLFLGKDQLIEKGSPADLTYIVTKGANNPLGNRRTETIDIDAEAKKQGVRIVEHRKIDITIPSEMELKNQKLEFFGNEFQVGLINALQKRIFDVYGLTVDSLRPKERASLKSDEILIATEGGYHGQEITVGSDRYHVKKVVRKLSQISGDYGHESLFLVFANKDQLDQTMTKATGIELNGLLTTKHLITVKNEIKSKSIFGKKRDYERTATALLTSFLFVGILIGISFMMMTLFILYYKQLSEGYADAKRYQTLKRVGLSHREIRETIKIQLLILFYLPLITSVIHVLFAIPLIHRILGIWGIRDLWALVSVVFIVTVVFLAIYIIMYKITKNIYYQIVTSHA